LGPPRRAAAAAAQPAQSKFPPQKTFGPPILSAIPIEDESEVNLKRQTFVPIQATMPKTQLPVITTPKQPAVGSVQFCLLF